MLVLESEERVYEMMLCQVVLPSSHLFALTKMNAGNDDIVLLETRSEWTFVGFRCCRKYKLVVIVPDEVVCKYDPRPS